MDCRDRCDDYKLPLTDINLKKHTATATCYDSELDEEVSMTVPIRMELCPICDGIGKYVNPNIDRNGLTASDFEEAGEQFREDYFSGVFDITCECCKGKNVIPVINTSYAGAEVKKFVKMLQDSREEEAACRRENQAELRREYGEW